MSDTAINNDSGAGAAPTSVLSVPVKSEASAPAVTTSEPAYAKEDWRSQLPAEMQQEAMFKTIGDVNTLAKSYMHAQKMVGMDKVALPGKHATEEDWHKFYQKAGLPESADKYEVTLPKEARHMTGDLLKELKPLAHQAGIMPKQLEKLINWYEENSAKTEAGIQETMKNKTAEGISGLKKEWGQAFGSKNTLAQKALKDFGPEGVVEYLEKTGLGNDPMIIRMLANLGSKLYKEDSIVGDKYASVGINTPGEANRKANEIIGTPGHPYHNPDHPNHLAAVQEVQALFDQMHGS